MSDETTESGKIDFEKEAEDAIVAFVLCERGGRGHRDCPHPEFHMEEWGRSVAARVEAEVLDTLVEKGYLPKRIYTVVWEKRLYAPKKEGTE